MSSRAMSVRPTLGEQADRLSAALRAAELLLLERFKVGAKVELPDGDALELDPTRGLRVKAGPVTAVRLETRVLAALALDRLIGACEAEHEAAVRRTGEAAERVERIVEELKAR